LFFASLQSCSVAIGTGVALIALSDAVELANTTKSTQFIVPSHQGFAGRARILTTPGVELVGPLPPEIQYYTAFVGGISAQSKAPDAALDLIKFLTGPIAIPVIKSQGMERLRWPLPVIFDRAVRKERGGGAVARWLSCRVSITWSRAPAAHCRVTAGISPVGHAFGGEPPPFARPRRA
jgi:hypothetical protein